MIKTFEQYNNSSSLDLQEVEKYLNNKNIMNKVNIIINQIPYSWKIKLFNFFQNEIDLNKIMNYNKKFKIIEKTIKLYKSGVKNIKDIYNKIIPKNESITFLGVIAIILMVVGTFIITMAVGVGFEASDEMTGRMFLIFLLIIGSGVGMIISGNKLKNREEEKKSMELEISFKIKKDNHKHDILVKIDSDGEYTVEEINSGEW